ncbi:universal stress protein [Novosphingobium sp.]|uniref:universal stress protein n=1 Tax=Novosphingobium sp. TaxID=1874826 RepID=UPI00286C45F3|nr:universal stress protein [Novosphingobium sp.]
MRSILVHTARDPSNAVRLDSAMDIARSHAGHVTLLIDTPVDRFVAVDPYGGSYVAHEALSAAIAEDDRLAELFEGRLASEDVPFDVVKFERVPLEAMLEAGKLADLIVVSRDCGFAGDLAVEASAPVLVVGKAALGLPLAAACVAWNGGSQAAAALRAAVPLLGDGATVSVLTVAEQGAAAFPATGALRYLARHGIKADLIALAKLGSVEETLANEVARQGAQLLVMGAYSHSRMRELLFGGVTRYFLEQENGPALLMAH